MATAVESDAIPYHAGPEHFPPFPPLSDHTVQYFRAVTPEKRTVFQVFDEKFKGLRLDCFPYREALTQVNTPKVTKGFERKKTRIDDFDWEKCDEKTFLTKWKSSPWYVECGWTDDLEGIQWRLLRAIRQPRLSAIFQQFTNLMFCGKEITTIDAQLMILRNLQVLSLPNNRIESVDLHNLGSSVQHLELYGNCVKQITGTPPPNLQHIGIAFNNIADLTGVLHKADLSQLTSLDISANQIVSDQSVLEALAPLTTLKNLHAAGNACSFFRTYKMSLVASIPRLVALDGDYITPAAREEHLSVSYESFKPMEANKQSVILLIIDDIKGLPQPTDYKAPFEQEAYPLTKWVHTVQVLFPGKLLTNKPPPPPPTPEQLKAEEKAKKEKEAKSKKNPKSPALPVPVAPVPEPTDPLYDGIPGIEKVASDSLDWAWADPLTIAVPVPLLFNADVNGIYEYIRRGMKVTLFQKKAVFTPKPAAGGKKTKTSKALRLTKGQKPDLWDVPLSSEIVESAELTTCVVPTLPLLHGDREAKFRWDFMVPTIVPPPPDAAPSPAAGSKKGKPNDTKGAKGKGKNAPVEPPEIKLVPATINFRVKIHHDERPNDLLMYPPDAGQTRVDTAEDAAITKTVK
ncbi:uncharacterized protein LOC129597532 isoform X2 [Paramacrobiotus metropolitanus]|uniref:uncharacterized protein LOC129597532 isoform X2 n=1 Tax=Paramacrobiotus metropolitanus TaxID=2943436 RepID=UPI0024457927|nr:uncharacterized protein LOC129597532 isoform X2 [Paramacrobiotus metropolitanus]